MDISFSITLLIVAVTVIISIMAFGNEELKMKTILAPNLMQHNNEWHRMLTSGFLHADWMHLLVNMYVLWIFGGPLLEEFYIKLFDGSGRLIYLGMYLSAIVIANVPSMLKHKDDPRYLSLGASGAVSAVVFGSILFYPDLTLYLFFAIPMPAVLFGALYLVYSFYMSKRGGDNINHDAHFVGAVYGFFFPVIFHPHLLLGFFEQIKNIL